MARKLVWPLLPEEHLDRERARWWQLTSEERLEVLKEWSDQQDARLAAIEVIVRAIKKVLWAIFIMVAGVLVKEYVGSYQLVRTNQVVLPAPTGAPSTAPDFPKVAPRP